MQYEAMEGVFLRVTAEGEREVMSAFEAYIIEEIRYVDGKNTDVWFRIGGKRKEGDKFIELPQIEIRSAEFTSMSWVLPSWGTKAIVFPGFSIKDDLRTAIQMLSKPKETTIYRHLGWTVVGGKRAYLHAGGAITRNGNVKTVKVEMPKEMERYDLTTDVDASEGVIATMDLVDLGPTNIMWTLLAATFSPLFGPVDFGTQLTGRTGTYKSEVMSLFQSHYGTGMDARHLPGSWSSTPNALEAQAYMAKNAPFVIDDFVPTGSAWQQRAYQQTADKIIRAQGNQAGRARLTDLSSLQTTMYPRGIVMSTGEDTPEGHSVRARMMIMELSPGDITSERLTKAQKNRHLYTATTVGLIKYLAENEIDINPQAEELRDKYIEVGHSRTPSMLGKLIAVAWAFLDWTAYEGFTTQANADSLKKEAEKAIVATAERQEYFLEAADPVEVFKTVVRQIFAAGLGHVRTLSSGIPKSPTMLGWTEEGGNEDMPTFKSHGPCIGWASWDKEELYIDVTSGLPLIKKVAHGELNQTKQTLMKRLKEAGILTRTDEARQRNTVRITVDGNARQVLSLNIHEVLETQETPGDGD